MSIFPISSSSAVDSRSLHYGLLATACFGVSAWAATQEYNVATVGVYLALGLYLLGAVPTAVRDAVPRYRAIAAIPLGIVGVVGLTAGAPTDLSAFFVVLALAGVVDLVWDPFGVAERQRG